MSGKGRHLTVEEKRLWRRVTAGAKPRRPAPAEPPEANAPPCRLERKPAAAAPKPAPAPSRIAPVTPPANRGGEKRVRRGRLDIDASLDLHGHTLASGRKALGAFLNAAYAHGARTVIVVTGVGRMGEGVLRRSLPDWLAEPDLRALISGYAPAHRTHGGAGAYYVFLKRMRETETKT